MRRASNLLLLAVLAGLPMIGTGCVQQDKYDALLESNRSLQEQLAATEDQRDTARANLSSVQSQLSEARGKVNQISQQNQRMRDELSKVATDYDKLMARVSALDVGPLPEDVESALTDLAANYPDVLSFDRRTGMLRFASDFTFDLGSTELSSNARTSLDTLAEILNSPNAQGFEVQIIGHTDNVPIGRPETRAKHPTNVHLSVHRAIAVRDALVDSGLDPVRTQVAGYGPHRPIVPNDTRRGAAENRRVEIFLTPMPTDIESSSTPQQSKRDVSTVAVPVEEPEPMK